jgi:hypothetical protein
MLTIAWDVDDVLNDLMRIWLREEWLPEHPQCRVCYEDLRANPPQSVLGASLEEYLASLDHFRRSRYAEIEPLAEAAAWFEGYGHAYRHIALTAAPLHAGPVSAAWVLRHYGRWIRSFHFVPSPRPGEALPEYDRSKREFLDWWGKADIVVDDMPANVEAAREIGIRAILMPRPWNGNSATLADAFRELERR